MHRALIDEWRRAAPSALLTRVDRRVEPNPTSTARGGRTRLLQPGKGWAGAFSRPQHTGGHGGDSVLGNKSIQNTQAPGGKRPAKTSRSHPKMSPGGERVVLSFFLCSAVGF